MIRKMYLDMVRGKLASGDLPWLARAGARYPLVHLSSLLGRPLCGPVLGSLVVTYRCNYGCLMCGIPAGPHGQEEAVSREHDTEGMLGIIDQLDRLGTLGLGFTGGEPLLREDIITLMEESVSRGMLTHLNTNGSLMTTEIAREIVSSGVHSVNVSIDGAVPSTQDRIRGTPGAWELAVQAVGHISRARAAGRKPRIKVVMVVMDENLREVPSMVDTAATAGADCLEYVPVQAFGARPGIKDHPPSRGKGKTLLDALREAERRSRGRIRIENSPRMTALMVSGLHGHPSPLRCYAGYNSLTVDCHGRVFPCHPWANWSRVVHDMELASLEDFWRSGRYGAVREEIAQCTDCTLNGQAELNLLFQPFRRI